MEHLTEEQEGWIVAHLYLPKVKARLYFNKNLAYDDLVQEGNLGLVKAARRYDPSFGTKFSTYAEFWVKQSIIEAITNKSRTIRLPSHIVNFKLKIYRFVESYLRSHEDEPTAKLIAEQLDIKLHIVELILGLNTEHLSNYETEEQLDYSACSDEAILDEVIEDQRISIVLDYIKGLSKKDQVVLGLKFGILNRL